MTGVPQGRISMNTEIGYKKKNKNKNKNQNPQNCICNEPNEILKRQSQNKKQKEIQSNLYKIHSGQATAFHE